jgi:hypothetical protein
MVVHPFGWNALLQACQQSLRKWTGWIGLEDRATECRRIPEPQGIGSFFYRADQQSPTRQLPALPSEEMILANVIPSTPARTVAVGRSVSRSNS